MPTAVAGRDTAAAPAIPAAQLDKHAVQRDAQRNGVFVEEER
jgi:hypothetical protein